MSDSACEQSETTKTANGNIKQLSVDHDHFTDQVRKLLCSKCNFLLGLANDDTTFLQKAIDYLKEFKENKNVAY
jgi:Recombination endonuclease VII